MLYSSNPYKPLCKYQWKPKYTQCHVEYFY